MRKTRETEGVGVAIICKSIDKVVVKGDGVHYLVEFLKFGTIRDATTQLCTDERSRHQASQKPVSANTYGYE